MNKFLIKLSLQVIFMLSIISNAFGFSHRSEDIQLMPRKIDFSGGTIFFSIPESFSKDMPESVSFSEKEVFEDNSNITLIQRWWDFESEAFFSKNDGSIMMTVFVEQVPLNSKYNILDPLEFIATIMSNYSGEIQQEKLQNNKIGEHTYYPDFYEAYSIKKFNSQQWLSYPVERHLTNQLDLHFARPISSQHYIVVAFSNAPTAKLSTREFIVKYGLSHMDSIMDTFSF